MESPQDRRARFGPSLSILVVICMTFACASNLSLIIFDSWLPIAEEEWTETGGAQRGDEHAVVLYDGYIINQSAPEHLVTDVSRYFRVRVLDAEGIARYGKIEIPIMPDEKIRHLRARTVKPDGTVFEVSEDDLYEKVRLSVGGTTVKAMSFAFEAVDAGDILELISTTEYHRFGAPKIVLRHEVWTKEAGVRWLFRPPPSWMDSDDMRYYLPSYILFNGNRFEPSIRELPEEKPDRVELELHDIPPMREEEFSLPAGAMTTSFVTQYVWPNRDRETAPWTRISGALYDQTVSFSREREGLDRRMAGIDQGERDYGADVVACLGLLHADIRTWEYMPDWERPDSPPENASIDGLIASGIGVERDVNRFFAAMLRHCGYDATIFWYCDRSRGIVQPGWRSLRQFHDSGVVVARGEALHWYFPSFPGSMPGAIPWQAAGGVALIEKGEENAHLFSALSRLPEADADMNQFRLEVRLHVGGDLVLRGRLKADWDCRSLLMTNREIAMEPREEARQLIRGRILPPYLDWVAHDESHIVIGSKVEYSCSLEVRGAVDRAGGTMLIDLGKLRSHDYQVENEPRETPLFFKYPAVYESEVTLLLPPGYEVAELPGTTSMASGLAFYYGELEEFEDRVELRTEFALEKDRYDGDDMAKVLDFLHEVYSSGSKRLVLAESGDPR